MYKSFGDFTTSGGTAEGCFNEDGTPQEMKVAALTRTYITAFQGTPLKMYYNPEDSSFTATFVFNDLVKESSQIYMNLDGHYPDGFTKTASVDGEAIENFVFEGPTDTNYFSITFDDPSAMHKKIVTVTITKNSPETQGTVEENKH